jgi:energy-coupling factor transporter ATP-binding protein EcfA2/histidinol phosphatase-like PHP family hydrolase
MLAGDDSEAHGMTALDEVLAQPTGARFFRADLHIHSFSGSHDVRDVSMTPAAIVATAARENLAIIAVTDHNEIINVEATIRAASSAGILAVPGVELSTPQGHLLCYLPTMDALQRFYGHLSIERGRPTSHCQQSMIECLNLLGAQKGFGVLAHVDAASGFEIEVPGASPHKIDVLCHPALLGIELKHATSPISYAAGDADPDRARMGRERISRLSLGSKQNLARVLNSDAHTLESLGRNAEHVRRVTRYKMDAPSFAALRVALEDAGARVRIEDLIPQAVPRILGVRFEGGFLDRQVIQFSSNLNCIIGGRGTGKSTTFEAVRLLAGDTDERSKVVDSEVWPEELQLFWQDAAGQQHTLTRPKEGTLQNDDDPVLGPHSFEIDCFGQGEAAKISVQAQTDPLALLHYLDRFVDFKDAMETEEAAREQLLKLQTEIEKADEKVKLIPQFEAQLSTTKKQLSALQKPEVKELIELQRKLATEREIRGQITTKLLSAKASVGQTALKVTIAEIQALGKPTQLAVGGVEFQAILDGAATFVTMIGTAETQVKGGLTAFEKLVTAQITNWKLKEAEAQKQIDAKRRELEALKVSFDMSYITKLAADEARHHQSVENLKTWKPHLVTVRKERATALTERWAARDRVATLRDAYARTATKTLKEALSDVQVSLKYARNAHSPDAADQIIQAMDWRTNQQPRAAWLVEKLTIPVLLDLIQRKDAAPILALKTPEGVTVFKRDEALAILERLGTPTVRFALERAALHDLPRLQLTRVLPDGKGGTRYLQRDFAKLSLGQQQSVLLALMLSSDSTRPLIIDQPEDNLDGEFIYATLVPVLRHAKERRQVIIVTHNANVAVLGDAEQIVVMKAMSDKGEIVARGSIDHPETSAAACAILEGAREAFLRRAKMYGIHVA